MQTVYGLSAGTWLERIVIDRLTVHVAASIVDAFDPDAHVRARGSHLTSPTGGINVLNGCEGTDVAFLLVSAMLVAPIAWRMRAAGVLAGLVLVFALNQARIVTLFYAARAHSTLFDALHGTVTPLLLVVAAAAFYAVWVAGAGRAPGVSEP